MKKINENLIAALDIGTSKVAIVVAEMLPDGEIEIIGIGSHPSRGIKKGVVVNIDTTVQAVRRALEEAELMAGCQIRHVYTNITGSHIYSFNSHGFVAVKSGEVAKEDVVRVIEAAKAISIPSEHKIIHVLPQEYTLDHHMGIQDPVGMSGVRLEGKVHIVTGEISVAQNIINCVRRCGLEIQDLILNHIASSAAVLTEDEKKLGVCLIDIGAGTTDIAVYTDGAIRHTAVIPVAGDQVTNDIAVVFHTSHQNAEAIKLRHGCALKAIADKTELINLPDMGNAKEQHINQLDLAEVIDPRFEELFALVLSELERTGWDGLLSAGIVLTGGSAKIPGLVELAEYIFQTHVRIGAPMAKDPSFATSIGLILHGQKAKGFEGLRKNTNMVQSINSAFGRVKNWFQGNF